MRKDVRLFQKLLLLLYLGVIIYLCFGRFDNLPSVSRTILGIPTDKLVHFAMFFPLTLLLYWSFNWNTDKPWKSMLLCIVLLLLGLSIGALTELGQGLTNYRSRDNMDFVADMISVSISSFLVFIFELIKHYRQCRKE